MKWPLFIALTLLMVGALFSQNGLSPVIPVPEDTVINAGKSFWIDINVGTPQEPVTDLFGISFYLYYTASDSLAPVSVDTVVQDIFLGADIIFFPLADSLNGYVAIALSRKRGDVGVSGAGTLARIRFDTDPQTPHWTRVDFTITSITANDSGYNLIELASQIMRIHIVQPDTLPLCDFQLEVSPKEQTVTAGDTARCIVTIAAGDTLDSFEFFLSNVPNEIRSDYALSTTIPSGQTDFVVNFEIPGDIPEQIIFPIFSATCGDTVRSDSTIIIIDPKPPIDEEYEYYVAHPNLITPNNDGYNDYVDFNVPADKLAAVQISIFDLYGRKIKKITNSERWDGRDNDENYVTPGTYLFILSEDDEIKMKGTITVAL